MYWNLIISKHETWRKDWLGGLLWRNVMKTHEPLLNLPPLCSHVHRHPWKGGGTPLLQ